MPSKVERAACRDRPDDRQERAGQPRCKAAAEEDHHHDCSGDAGGRHVNLRQPVDNLGQLLDRPATVDRHTQHLAEHGDANLKADAGEESDQHRLR